MEIVTHHGKSLTSLIIYPDGYDASKKYPAIFLLHGFGANMGDLATLAPEISPTGYVYLFPNAPVPMRMNGEVAGFSWGPPREQATPETRRETRDVLNAWIDEMFGAVPSIAPGNAVLLGFSQGGGMAYRCGLPRPETFKGVVALSAATPDMNELEECLPAKRSQELFLTVGEWDRPGMVDKVPLAQEFLKKAGYPLFYRKYAMGHEISPDVIADLQSWLRTVLPPVS